MGTQRITVPDSPGAGPWVDCSGLGREPLAQLTKGVTSSDQVRIETAADNAGDIGMIAASNPLTAHSPVVVDKPISWVRAVRIGGSTPDLQVVIRATNASAVGAGGASQPDRSNKNMAALTTTVDGDLATSAGVTNTPVGWIGVVVNGLVYMPGDGSAEAPCYYSGDGGVTPRAQGSVAACIGSAALRASSSPRGSTW